MIIKLMITTIIMHTYPLKQLISKKKKTETTLDGYR